VLTAPLLGHGINVAAPMTALCANPAVHPEARGRYVATVSNGLWFIAFGLVGATAISLIQALPPAFVAVIAGLALFPVLRQAFRLSTGPVKHSAAAAFALLIAASNVSLLGINATFWAIVAGLALARFLPPEPERA
jgi:benzoate membrane transport protein